MRRLQKPAGEPVPFDFEGRALSGFSGEPIACALLVAGERVFARSIKYHRPRGPFCLAASCSQCLMRVGGVPNVMTCQAPVRPHVRVERQNAYPSAQVDALAALDWFFPRGLDHHRMLAGVPLAQEVMQKVARQLAGLGLLPDSPAPTPPPCETVRTQVAIVGAGAAGTAAAEVLEANSGVRFAVVEKDDFAGDPPPSGRAERRSDRINGAGLRAIRLHATAIGLYSDREGRFLAACGADERGTRLLKLYAERFLLCTGGHPQVLPFENNDLPGVLAGRAARALLRRHHLAPEGPVALVGQGEELYELAQLFARFELEVAAVVDISGAPPAGPPGAAVHGTELKAHGRNGVTGLSFLAPDGRRRRLDCRWIAVSLPPAPSFELAQQGGARVVFSAERGLLQVEADGSGRTSDGALFAAGDVLGPMSLPQAAASGQRAAQALIRGLA